MRSDSSLENPRPQKSFHASASLCHEFIEFTGWYQELPHFIKPPGIVFAFALDVYLDMLGRIDSFSKADQNILKKAKDDPGAPEKIREANLFELQQSRQEKIQTSKRLWAVLAI